MAEFLPIMLALCSMLLYTHCAKNYAGIIDAGLNGSQMYSADLVQGGMEEWINSTCICSEYFDWYNYYLSLS